MAEMKLEHSQTIVISRQQNKVNSKTHYFGLTFTRCTSFWFIFPNGRVPLGLAASKFERVRVELTTVASFCWCVLPDSTKLFIK